jgi:3-hydroxybutyryl-CoA dehydrogenase
MKNISVIGCGTMGNGIAHVFAMNGFKVQLIDINEVALQKALEKISNNLERQVVNKLLLPNKKQKL